MEEETKALLAANAAFYAAFQSLDFDVLCSTWNQTPYAYCIHPGWDILRGWDSVRESWRAIMSSAAYMKIDVSDTACFINGTTAWVTCVENIYTISEGITTHATVASTNIFESTAAGWKLVAHHGSPTGAVLSMNDEVEN